MILNIVLVILILIITTFAGKLLLWMKFKNRQLNENIEQLLRIDNAEDLCRELVSDIVEVFGFDYAVISLVAFKERTISSKYAEINPKIELGDANPDKWKQMSSYSLEDNDILVGLIKTRKKLKVFNNELGEKITDQENKEYILNKQFKDVHENIARIYIPLVYKKSKQSDEDVALGIVELGFKTSYWKKFSFERLFRYIELFSGNFLSKWAKDISFPSNHEIYINFFTQHYYKILYKELEVSINNYVFNEISSNNEDLNHPDEYLQEVLDRTRTFFNAEYAMIAFDTFNSTRINYTDKVYFSGEVAEEDILESFKAGQRINKFGNEGITALVLEKGEPYFTKISADKDEYYVKSLNKYIISELIAPLKQEGKNVGIFILDSEKYYYFNSIYANLLDKIAKRFMPNYLRKKRYLAYRALSEQINPWEKTQDVLLSIAKQLALFFDSKYIYIWKRKNENSFFLIEVEENRSEYLPNNLIKEAKDLSQDLSNQLGIYRCTDQEEIENNFNSYLLIPIVIQFKTEAYIQILSKRSLSNDLIKRERDFLQQISNKARIAIQGLKLVSSFSEISQVLTTPNSDLRVIVRGALDVMNADIVSYFEYNERPILRREGIFEGILFEEYNSDYYDGEAVTANLIVKTGTKWFSNQIDFQKYFKENGINLTDKMFTTGFKHANSIQSFAAVRIEHQSQPLGVIFFNYKHAIDFNKRNDLKELINDYSRFLGLQIATRGLLTRIQESLNEAQKNRNKFENDIKFLQKEKSLITFNLEDKRRQLLKLEKEFIDILPRATRTSFYQILEGINHSIKHSLFQVYLSIKNVDVFNSKLTNFERHSIEESKAEVKKNITNVENMLKLFDFNNQDLENININMLIKRVITFFKTNDYKSIQFILNFEQEQIVSLVNRAEFTMIIYNLINNSVQAILEGVEVKTANTNVDKLLENKKIEISTNIFENNIVIKVWDNGIGIDNNLKTKIFERGFSTKKEKQDELKGTGIGLYFVKEIIEKEYCGTVICESQKGQWTRFIIRIPIQK